MKLDHFVCSSNESLSTVVPKSPRLGSLIPNIFWIFFNIIYVMGLIETKEVMKFRENLNIKEKGEVVYNYYA